MRCAIFKNLLSLYLSVQLLPSAIQAILDNPGFLIVSPLAANAVQSAVISRVE
jgi:hypothetical protein